jgi:2-keto-4-pentenoate hydratase
LFATDRHVSGVELRLSDFARLAIEGELAVQLSEDIPGDNTSDDEPTRIIGTVFPVIELHHHVIRGRGSAATELIANNAIHAGFVMPSQPAASWQDVCVDLEIRLDYEVVETCATRPLCHIGLDRSA